MIDIHCHLLPFTDDGPRTWEDSFAMCEGAIDSGITHVVATPHCNLHYPYDRAACQDKIKRLGARFPSLGISLGCEFTIGAANLDAASARPGDFTLGASRYILVEVNEVLLPKQNEEGLQELIGLGLVPVLAHPERNTVLRSDHRLLADWISMGCLSALTGNALTGFWGSQVRAAAEQMLRKDLVHCIVSDAHDPVLRPLSLTAALSAAVRIVGQEHARSLAVEIPGRIVAGQPV